MKRFLASLKIFFYPVFKLMILASILTAAAVSGVFWKQQAQTLSSVNKANKQALLKNRDRAIFANAPVLYPSEQATMVNPDVQLKLTFKDVPRVGMSGKIRIFDAADDRLVETLDMSIPPGPTKPVDPSVRAK